MKNVKYFKYFESKSLYDKIDENDFDSFEEEYPIKSVSELLLNNLKDLSYNDNWLFNIETKSSFINFDPDNNQMGDIIKFIEVNSVSSNPFIMYSIHLHDDDWYIVEKSILYRNRISSRIKTSRFYYKCDQIEGLINFLNDENVIKKK